VAIAFTWKPSSITFICGSNREVCEKQGQNDQSAKPEGHHEDSGDIAAQDRDITADRGTAERHALERFRPNGKKVGGTVRCEEYSARAIGEQGAHERQLCARCRIDQHRHAESCLHVDRAPGGQEGGEGELERKRQGDAQKQFADRGQEESLRLEVALPALQWMARDQPRGERDCEHDTHGGWNPHQRERRCKGKGWRDPQAYQQDSDRLMRQFFHGLRISRRASG
jgi:hypothetical protein